MRIVLDTDVASVSLRQQLPPAVLRQISGHEPAITFVTIGELVKWVHLRDLGQRRRREIETFIAAPLATLNVGHFEDFVEFEGLRLVTA